MKKEMLKLAFQQCKEGYWISKEWLKSWKTHIENEYNEKTEDTPEEILSLNMTELITCSHGGLSSDSSTRKVIPSKVWDYLLKTYKDSAIYPSFQSPCKVCEQQDEEEQKKREKIELERRNEEVCSFIRSHHIYKYIREYYVVLIYD